jgi:phage-related protein
MNEKAESWAVTVIVETGEVTDVGEFPRQKPMGLDGPTPHYGDCFIRDQSAIRFTSWVSPEHAVEGAKAIAAVIREWTVDGRGRRVAMARELA